MTIVVPSEADVTFSNGVTVRPTALRYSQRHNHPIAWAWMIKAKRKDGSAYRVYGFSVSEHSAKEAFKAAKRTVKSLKVMFEEVRKI